MLTSADWLFLIIGSVYMLEDMFTIDELKRYVTHEHDRLREGVQFLPGVTTFLRSTLTFHSVVMNVCENCFGGS